MRRIINLEVGNDEARLNRLPNTMRYYNDIRKYQTMSKEEEKQWFIRLRDGTEKEKKEAREHIIKCNQRLVIATAKRYANENDLTDYINEANIGLMEAIDKFDVSMDFKFSSYAVWFLVRSINAYKYNTLPMVRQTNQYKIFHTISKAQNKFFQENERYPTDDELLDILNNVYHKEIQEKTDVIKSVYSSIDVAADDDDKAGFGDVIEFQTASASTNGYVSQMDNNFNKILLKKLFKYLTKRETDILMMRFGMYEDNGLKREFELSEIGERIGLTPERVRQLELGAIKKLQDHYGKSFRIDRV